MRRTRTADEAIVRTGLKERLEAMRSDLESAVARFGSLSHPCVVAYSRCFDTVLNRYHLERKREGC